MLRPIYPNRINGAIKAKLKGLVAQLDETKSIEHSLSKGSLREKYLKDFLRKVLPSNFIISGGFICDSANEISKQIDLILCDTTKLPQILLSEEVSLVPVECTIGTIEVKSILNEAVLEQIQKQIESIGSQRIANWKKKKGKFGVRHYIFAYESNVSEKKISQWFDEIELLVGVCVLGDKFYFKTVDGYKSFNGDEFDEVLQFLSTLIQFKIQVENERSALPNNIWRYYLEGTRNKK